LEIAAATVFRLISLAEKGHRRCFQSNNRAIGLKSLSFLEITMSKSLLDNFERAIRQRNKILSDRLQPGLPDDRIQRMLKRAKVEGAIGPVVSLFSWRNGSRLDPSLTLGQASPFPGSVYIFMDFEMMLAHFRGFKELAGFQPKFAEVVGRYFPLFWDGATGYLAVDLKPLSHSRIAMLDPESESFVTVVYESFEDFLKDAIRANQENDNLTCFHIR
jgi:hypothetical protein